MQSSVRRQWNWKAVVKGLALVLVIIAAAMLIAAAYGVGQPSAVASTAVFLLFLAAMLAIIS